MINKTKITISIDKSVNDFLISGTINKSKLINKLLVEYLLNNKKYGK
jgi:hypothetical protein